MNLGKLEKVSDLREVWKHEAHDFSKWLSVEENMHNLSDAIGIDLIVEELESSVGGFSVDLYASEEGSGRKVIIENQLEDTNHDHLGKIITYAAGKQAEVIIWIVKRARDEHRQAVEWLNNHTDVNIGIFLIEIELWKIGDSPLAARFNVIERPNDWAKTIKTVEGLSDTKKLQLEFWQFFNNNFSLIPEFAKAFSMRKPQAQHWYDLSVGKSDVHIGMTVNTQKKKLGTEIYFNDNKELYDVFMVKKNEIEKELDCELIWRKASKDCRILAVHAGDIKTSMKDWDNYLKWLQEMALKMKQIITVYGN